MNMYKNILAIITIFHRLLETFVVGAQFIAPNCCLPASRGERVSGGGCVSGGGRISGCGRNELRPYVILCLLIFLVAACDTAPANQSHNHTLPTNNGSITYSTNPQDVLIRTFHGGGKSGTLDLSPEISIYGDGTYILGPGLQMRAGQLGSDTLQQLLNGLVNTDGLMSFHRQRFTDLPDQNGTLLQFHLNGKTYEYTYGKFGYQQESTGDMDEYHRLDKALTRITSTLTGSTHAYNSTEMTLLVHQEFAPDLLHDIPTWTVHDFTLSQVAIYECGVLPPNTTSPNGDTGCLTFTIPQHAFLPNSQQIQAIQPLMKGQQNVVFYEQGLYYRVEWRPLLPDEAVQGTLAMFGSEELNYTGVPLHGGAIPTPGPTP